MILCYELRNSLSISNIQSRDLAQQQQRTVFTESLIAVVHDGIRVVIKSQRVPLSPAVLHELLLCFIVNVMFVDRHMIVAIQS